MHVCTSEANFTEVCLINILGTWHWKLRNLWVIIKAMHSPEVDLSTVNISILINNQAILVHFVSHELECNTYWIWRVTLTLDHERRWPCVHVRAFLCVWVCLDEGNWYACWLWLTAGGSEEMEDTLKGNLTCLQPYTTLASLLCGRVGQFLKVLDT